MGREREAEKETIPAACRDCGYYGFSFGCVEGYCTLKGQPVEELAQPCERFDKEGE